MNSCNPMEVWSDGKDLMDFGLYSQAPQVESSGSAEPATTRITRSLVLDLIWGVRLDATQNYLGMLMFLGTSTDVSRYGGLLTHTLENVIAGVTVQSPQLDITTVAAGGGSILTYRNGLFNAGPQSAVRANLLLKVHHTDVSREHILDPPAIERVDPSL